MADPEPASVAAHLFLSAACLYSAVRTLQEHRGAAAGFLLQGAVSLIVVGEHLLPEHLTSVKANSWAAGVLGLPLLAFSFFWIYGDHLTANLFLGVGLLLGSASGSLSQETQHMAACLTNGGVALGLLVLSVFTSNGYGVLGSLALGVGGLLTSLEADHTLEPFCEVAASFVYSTSFLALHMALRTACT